MWSGLADARGTVVTRCVWTLDSDEWSGDSWDTTCDQKFQFTVGGGPVENGFKYCPYCGEDIQEAWLLQPDDPEVDG